MIDWSGWSEWENLAESKFSEIPSGPGAYCISANRTIPRVKGSDPNGILHVGESGYLRNRIFMFHCCAGSLEVAGHMAGWRFAFFD